MRRRETHQTARAAHRLCVSGEGAEVFAGKWFLRIPRGDLGVIHSELTVPKTRGWRWNADRQRFAVAGKATSTARLLEAVLVGPDHGVYLPCSGTAEPDPTKVVPLVPKPPFTEGQ